MTTIATVDETLRRRFEEAWKQGPPRIEEFLPPADSPAYAATLLELVAIDLEMSWKAGIARSADDYLARFPALRAPDHVRELAREEDRARRAAAQTVRAGATLGRYQLTDVHARGGFGVVWRAHDSSLGREVALKTLAQPRDPEARRRFVDEARTASRLEHPGVVPVHELAEGDAPWYSMKLVRGKTLAQLIRSYARGDRLAWRRLVEAFLAIARAVAFAHARGLMHRDLKPDNIVVGEFGETVVLDWGLARPIAGPAEPEGSVMGTPGYMPPEQLEGRVSAHDARSDVYALGKILSEIVQLDRAPRALAAIARHATQAAPEDRYRDAGALAEDLERFLSDEKVSTHREGLRERLARSYRRHRTRWAVGIAATVVAAIGAAAALVIAHDASIKHQRDLLAEAVRDETRAHASLVAGRANDAVTALDEALGELAGEPALADERAKIAGQRDRAHRADVFATARERAWFLSGEERDAAALDQIAQGAAAVGPRCSALAAELPPDRLDDCRRALHRLLLLEGVLRAKRALSQPFQAVAACDEAQAALDRARAEGPTAFADVVQILCARLSPKIVKPTPHATPPSSTDAYMFGLAYLFVGNIPKELQPMLAPALAEAGLDTKDPLATAIDRFRDAVRLEPGEYWHSFMLGGALTAHGDYLAAELALDHCISLRPDYPRALEARGLASVLAGDRERGRADYDRALALAPNDPWTHWARAHLFVQLGQPGDAMPEYLVALETDPDALPRVSRPADALGGLSTAPEVESARTDAAARTAAAPTDAAAWTVHATASLVLEDPKTARASLDRALALPSPPPLAHKVRDILLSGGSPRRQ